MRAVERLLERYQAEDAERLADGARAIASSPEARFFIRWYMQACGMAANPFAGNALTTAYASGKMAACQELIAAISEHDPFFHPKLLMEEANDRTSRDTELARRAEQSARSDDELG